MKRTLLVPLFCLMATIVMGQGYIGPSPNATAVMRQANVGVSHYTGTPNITIPLADISGRELGASVTLSYNSFGHRVQDVASSEGLGWTLAAGGMITRVVRDQVDEAGFCSTDNIKQDKEPDLFIFSFMGRSGKFVLDKTGVPVLLPYQDLKIIPGMCGNGYIWEIIDESGTRYQFGVREDALEKTQRTSATSPTETFVSTWHLSNVISMNGTDEMHFNYVSSSISYSNYFYTKEDLPCSQDTGLKDLSSRLTISSKYISSIATTAGTIEFTWNNSREDLSGAKSLAEVKVKDLSDNYTKKLRFEYSYFQGSGCNSQMCKRLRLDRIFDLSPEPLYLFRYNVTENLPSRDSKSIDYLGLYNNYTGSDWIPYYSASFGGASRAPNALKMRANLLTQIDYRGGARTLFEYEPHSGYFGQEYSPILSGNRIKNIHSFDGISYTQQTAYNYVKENSTQSSGLLFKKSIWGIEFYYGSILNILKRFSHSYNDIFDVNGTHVGYSRVEEVIAGKGKTIYTFTNYDQYPDLDPDGSAQNGSPPFVSSTSRFWERGNLTSVTVKDLSDNTISKDTLEYSFDHPDKSVVTGEVQYLVFNECQNRYEPINGNYKVISRAFTLKKKTSELFDQTVAGRKITTIEEYEYDPVRYQLITVRRWNAADPSEKYAKKYKYVTHSDYNFSSSQFTACSNTYNQCIQNCDNPGGTCENSCYSTFLSCVGQSTSDAMVVATQALRNRHANNTLIEEQSWLEKGSHVLLGSALNLFKMTGQANNLIVPATIWTIQKVTGSYTGTRISSGQFVRPSAFKLVKTFDTYENTHARLTKETARDGTIKQYSWVYNNALLGSTTVNPGTDQQMLSYFYRPLVGVIQEKDANNNSVYTEYDQNGRARLIKDNDGNIRERYRYHYKNETPNITIRPISSQAITGQTINFTLEDLVLPGGGVPGFAWDMGNGTVHDDNRRSVTQTYTAPGLYTVKAVMFTNEFKPYTATKDLLVSNPLRIDVCADGPQEIDLCYENPPIYGFCTVNNNYPSSATVFHANFSTLTSTGCIGMYTYKWEYKRRTESSWTGMSSTTSSAVFPPRIQEGNYQVRCTVTDGCGNSVTSESYIHLYKSNTSC